GYWRAAARQRGDPVHEEAVLAIDRLLAGPDIGMGDKVDELIRATATHDALGIKPVSLGNGMAQRTGGPIRIAVQLLSNGLIGGDRLGARAQRRLGGGKLDRPHAAAGGAF